MALGTGRGAAARCYRGRVVGSGLDADPGEGRSGRQPNRPLAKDDRPSRFAWDLTGSPRAEPCRVSHSHADAEEVPGQVGRVGHPRAPSSDITRAAGSRRPSRQAPPGLCRRAH